MKPLSLLFLIFSVSGLAQTAASSAGPLTNVRVIQLVQAGLSAAEVTRIIFSAPTVDFNLTPAFTNQLLQYGVSEDTIKLMSARVNGIAPPSQSLQPNQSQVLVVTTLLPGPNLNLQAIPTAGPLPDDVGVYFRSAGGEWTEIEPEVVNWKTGGVVKSLLTEGVVKGDINGHVRGGEAKTKILSNEILVVTPEGVSVTEYQLLRMREHAESREFRAITGGIFHASGGSDRDILDFEHRKIARRTFIVVLPASLRDGNYGLLPPGASGSRTATSIGKIYTFRIVN
jgi:hypothetical protein